MTNEVIFLVSEFKNPCFSYDFALFEAVATF
jgi:hypothetical protein